MGRNGTPAAAPTLLRIVPASGVHHLTSDLPRGMDPPIYLKNLPRQTETRPNSSLGVPTAIPLPE
jgi:hypothetical protein